MQIDADNDLLMLTQFYKREENQVLFNLYQTIYQDTMRPPAKTLSQQAKTSSAAVYFSYSDLCRKFNARHASSKKRNKLEGGNKIKDVAHYCKKLEKCGFLACKTSQNSSERQISLRRQQFAIDSKKRHTVDSDQLYKAIRKRWTMLDQTGAASQAQASTAMLAAERLAQPQWAPTKRQKLAAGDSLSAVRAGPASETNAKVFDLFLETRMTMREGLIRVLEQQIDTTALKQEASQQNQAADDSEDGAGADEHMQDALGGDYGAKAEALGAVGGEAAMSQQEPQLGGTIALRRSSRRATQTVTAAIAAQHGGSGRVKAENEIRQEYFTVTDISNTLGMAKEEKTMSRVLSELRRIHSKQI